MNKKLLVAIVITVVIFILAGVVLYISFFSEPKNRGVVTDSNLGGGLFSFLGQDRADLGVGVNQNEGVGLNENFDFSNIEVVTKNSGPILQQLWDQPVVGAAFGTTDGGSTTVRFIDRATGNVYQALLGAGNIERITNTTIPKTQHAQWVSDDRLVLRYLQDEEDVVETFVASVVLPAEQSSTSPENIGEVRGQFLPVNILELAVRNDGELFYLIGGIDGIRGVVSSFFGDSAREVFSSPIRDWIPEWFDNETIALTTKASSGIPGSVVFVDVESGEFSPVLSGFSGITSESGSGKILYTIYENTTPKLFLYERASGQTQPMSINTLTEKCVWGSGDKNVFCAVPKNSVVENLPDVWYQGVVSFDDVVWKINTETFVPEMVFDPEDYPVGSLDVVDLSVNETEEHLLFKNKENNTLWLFSYVKEVDFVEEF